MPGLVLTYQMRNSSFAVMKSPTRRSVSSRAKARNSRPLTAPRQPSFATAAKRGAGMTEGTFDLSSREGFGPPLSR